MSLLRLDLVPSAEDPALVIAVVVRIAAGCRLPEDLADALGESFHEVQGAIDAGIWLSLINPGEELQLSPTGLSLAGAPAKKRLKLYANAVWRQPLAREVLRGRKTLPNVEHVAGLLMRRSAALSPARAARSARHLLGLVAPALEHRPGRRTPLGDQLALPLPSALRPAGANQIPDDAAPAPANPTESGAPQWAADALTDHGELSPSQLLALLSDLKRASPSEIGAVAHVIDGLIQSGLATRVGDQIVAFGAEPGPEGPYLDQRRRAGLAICFPSSLSQVTQGISALNATLRDQKGGPAGSRTPTALDPRQVVHGGLCAPRERPPRSIPDSLTLRLRAISNAPAFTLLSALLLLDRQERIELRAGRVRRGRTDLGGVLTVLSDFAIADGQRLIIGPTSLSEADLLAAAEAIGLMVRADGRLRLDEALYARLQSDPEASLVGDALVPLCRAMDGWLEGLAPGPAERVFVYGSLLRGQCNAHHVADLPARPATTRGRLFLLPEGYPALVPDPLGLPISGELLSLDARRLALLDDFEDVAGGLYNRVRVPVRVGRRTEEAWAYALTDEIVAERRAPALTLRDWRNRDEEAEAEGR